jgi:hypothetical protein
MKKGEFKKGPAFPLGSPPPDGVGESCLNVEEQAARWAMARRTIHDLGLDIVFFLSWAG